MHLESPFAPIGLYYYFESTHVSHAEHQDNEDYSHIATALLSLFICLGTVQLAFMLRKVKYSPFLPNQTMRNLVTDFAVVTSIVVMTVIAQVLFRGVELETLNVPEKCSPTFQCCTESCETSWPDDCLDQEEPVTARPWFVNLGDLNGKNSVPFLAAGPAALAFILVFLDDGITWHLINHPSHKLKHGAAYNYDTLLIGIMILINSLFGLPWLVAATVRSLSHIHALAEKDPDGKILSVKETRLSHLFIHLFCFASIFALDILKLIPMPVLYGVFLFMGLVSLGTNQFWGRILMFFMQPSKCPLEPYTIHMRAKRMHLFTAFQLGLFILLYTVKAIKSIAIAFPIIIALCIPVRVYLLPKIFTEVELIMVDSDDETIAAWLRKHSHDTDQDETHHLMTESFSPVNNDAGPSIETDIENGLVVEQISESLEKFEKENLNQTQSPPRSLTESAKQRHHRHLNRRKVVSCPSPAHSLFSVDEHVRATTAPLGDISKKPRTRKRSHKKTLSCPVGHHHAMFAEIESGRADIQLEVVTEEPHLESQETTSDEMEDSRTSSGLPRRRDRHKSMSCPTHVLNHEVERQLASSYFFG